jgi:hypothetical protein
MTATGPESASVTPNWSSDVAAGSANVFVGVSDQPEVPMVYIYALPIEDSELTSGAPTITVFPELDTEFPNSPPPDPGFTNVTVGFDGHPEAPFT